MKKHFAAARSPQIALQELGGGKNISPLRRSPRIASQELGGGKNIAPQRRNPQIASQERSPASLPVLSDKKGNQNEQNDMSPFIFKEQKGAIYRWGKKVYFLIASNDPKLFPTVPDDPCFLSIEHSHVVSE